MKKKHILHFTFFIELLGYCLFLKLFNFEFTSEAYLSYLPPDILLETKKYRFMCMGIGYASGLQTGIDVDICNTEFDIFVFILGFCIIMSSPCGKRNEE